MKNLFALLMLFSLGIFAVGCDTDTPAENAVEEVEKATDNAAEAVEEAGDEVKETVE